MCVWKNHYGVLRAADHQARPEATIRHVPLPRDPGPLQRLYGNLVADDAPASIEATRAQRRRQAAATEAPAQRRARQERAARESGTPTDVPQSAALRDTARADQHPLLLVVVTA